MRYKNPHVGNIRRRLIDVILWKVGYYGHGKRRRPVPDGFVYPRGKYQGKDEVTWIGHSTFWIRMHGINVLTDPVFGKRCSPLKFFGPVRRHPPGVELENLPKMDVVLVSHNHYDHLEKAAVLAIHQKNSKALWLVPEGTGDWFVKLGIEKVVELGWWDRYVHRFGKTQVEFAAVPTQHFSGRHLLNVNKSLWVGWVMTVEKKRLYFTGDTGYNRYDFRAIGEEFGAMDLSLIPIGTYEPTDFMKPVHIDGTSAVRIHRDVKSKFSIGMHWRTFHLSDEGMERPPYDLYRAMKRAKMDPKKFIPVEPGETINW